MSYTRKKFIGHMFSDYLKVECFTTDDDLQQPSLTLTLPEFVKPGFPAYRVLNQLLKQLGFDINNQNQFTINKDGSKSLQTTDLNTIKHNIYLLIKAANAGLTADNGFKLSSYGNDVIKNKIKDFHKKLNPENFDLKMFDDSLTFKCQYATKKSKPRLRIILSNTYPKEFDDALKKLLNNLGCGIEDIKIFRGLTLKATQKFRTWEIKGDRLVEEAVAKLLDQAKQGMIVHNKNQLKLQSYTHAEDEQKLMQFQQVLARAINLRSKQAQKDIPKRSVSSDQLTSLQEESLPKHTHDVYQAKIGDDIYFVKYNPGPITQIEALASELYRLLVGKDRAPQSLVIYENGMRRGIASQKMEGFTPLLTILKDKPSELDNTLIKNGIGIIEVAHLVWANADAHINNVGINKQNQICVIDFDRALFPLTAKYSAYRSNEIIKIENENSSTRKIMIYPSPLTMFPIHREDLTTLPKLKHAQPLRGLYNTYSSLFENDADARLSDIAKNTVHDKWQTFLKYLLINEDYYKSLISEFISSRKLKSEILTFLIDRREQFKNELLSIDDFKDFCKDENNINKAKEDLKEFGIEPHIIDKEWSEMFEKKSHQLS